MCCPSANVISTAALTISIIEYFHRLVKTFHLDLGAGNGSCLEVGVQRVSNASPPGRSQWTANSPYTGIGGSHLLYDVIPIAIYKAKRNVGTP